MDPQPGPGHRPPLWPAAALSGVLAVLWLWPCLSCGFLNDDFLVGYYLEQQAQDLRIDAGRVWGDLTGPFFGIPFLYRPFVTLSILANLATGGVHPFGFHLWNLLLVAGAAIGTGLLCALHAQRALLPAALFGAALVVLHPAAVEPACWMAGRTSTQAVCFSALCMAAFAARLRGRLATPWLEVLCAIPALGSREEAVMLPFALLALDLLHRTRRPPLERVRLLLPVALTVLGYLALRVVFLGGLAPAKAGAFDPALYAANLVHRLGLMLWPPGSGAVQTATGALLLIALVGAAARRPFVLMVGTAWLVAVLAPTLGIAPKEEAMGGRFTWPALPVIAVVVSALGWRPDAARTGRLLLFAAAVAALSWAPLSHRLLGHFRQAAEQVEAIQAGLLAIGEDVEPGRPLAITSLRTGNPLRLVHSKAFFPLVEKPFAPRDVPVAGLGFVLEGDANAPDLYLDPTAVYAFAELGSPIISWDAAARSVRARSWPERREVELRRVGGSRFSGANLHPLSFELVHLRVGGSPADGSLSWWTEPPRLGGLADVRPARVERGADSTLMVFDVTGSLAALVCDELDLEFRGFRVNGIEEGRVLSLRLVPRADSLPLPEVLGGRELSLRESIDVLKAPAAAAGAMRLLVVGPTTGQAMQVRPGEPVRLSAGIRSELEYACNVARQQRFYYFFQSGAARSPVDWFRVRDKP